MNKIKRQITRHAIIQCEKRFILLAQDEPPAPILPPPVSSQTSLPIQKAKKSTKTNTPVLAKEPVVLAKQEPSKAESLRQQNQPKPKIIMPSNLFNHKTTFEEEQTKPFQKVKESNKINSPHSSSKIDDILDDTIPRKIKKHYFTDQQMPNLIRDYDAIGFDIDHCMVKYNVKNFISYLSQIQLTQLVKTRGYPEQMLDIDIEDAVKYCLNGSLYDFQNSNVLKLGQNQKVLMAMNGFKALDTGRIQDLYGRFPTFKAYQWPYSKDFKFRQGYWSFLTYFGVTKIIAALQAQELRLKGILKNNNYDMAQDFKKIEQTSFIDFFEDAVVSDKGQGPPEIFTNQAKFIQQQPYLKELLIKLKQHGKFLFLASNSNPDYSNFVMNATLGNDWKDYFDTVCCRCFKPDFFDIKNNRPFIKIEANDHFKKGINIFDFRKLEHGKVFTNGSSRMLEKYIESKAGNKPQRIVFFGDHYIGDIYASAKNKNWDAIAVVEELVHEDPRYSEGIEHQKHDTSEKWGNFFFEDHKLFLGKSNKTYFMSKVEQNARYMIPLIKNIDLMMK